MTDGDQCAFSASNFIPKTPALSGSRGSTTFYEICTGLYDAPGLIFMSYLMRLFVKMSPKWTYAQRVVVSPSEVKQAPVLIIGWSEDMIGSLSFIPAYFSGLNCCLLPSNGLSGLSDIKKNMKSWNSTENEKYKCCWLRLYYPFMSLDIDIEVS